MQDDLEEEGVAFQGESNNEVLLNLYITKGEGMVPMLNGIFAFAIWDSRKQELFIAAMGLGLSRSTTLLRASVSLLPVR